MPTYVVLLRAVNVGGRYYKMADLRGHLTDSGLTEVETYIQTGNVRLRSRRRSAAAAAADVEAVLREHCGFEVPSIVLSPSELRRVHDQVEALPVPTTGSRPGSSKVRRFVTFFKPGEAPVGEVAERIAAWDEPGEAAAVVHRAVHLWTDRPYPEVRFFGAFKKALAPGTARDVTVVRTLAERWGADPGAAV
jgi:uncharacterized protein (DUF1697 family)